MAVRKISVALDEEVADAATSAADAHGQSLSSWLTQAARTRLRTEEGLAAVREWEHEHGPLTDDERRAARAAVDDLLRGTRRSG